MFLIVRLLFNYGRLSVFHNLAVPVLHLFIWIVKFLSLYVDELNDDDDDGCGAASVCFRFWHACKDPRFWLDSVAKSDAI